MKRVGALVQASFFVLSNVLLRLSNTDTKSEPFHPTTMLVLASVVLGLSLLVRGSHWEPFFERNTSNPRWAKHDAWRKKRPLLWRLNEYAQPFDWVLVGGLIWWLARHVDEPQPLRGVEWMKSGAVPPLQHVLLGLVLISGFIYLSTLVDEFYILPRLKGAYWHGAIQCVADDLRGQPNVGNWRGITRLWLAHRLVAQAAGVTTAGVIILMFLSDLGVDVSENLILAPAAALASIYLASRFPVLLFILNPSLSVGDTVELAEEHTVRLQFPVYFVVDVSLEGIKLLIHGIMEKDSLQPAPASLATGRTHDRVVAVSDVGKLLRNRESARPCKSLNYAHEQCLRINRYCPIRQAEEQSGAALPVATVSGTTTIATGAAMHAGPGDKAPHLIPPSSAPPPDGTQAPPSGARSPKPPTMSWWSRTRRFLRLS